MDEGSITSRNASQLRKLPPSLSLLQAAELLGISRATAYRLKDSGEFPGLYQVGSRYRAATAAVLERMGVKPAA